MPVPRTHSFLPSCLHCGRQPPFPAGTCPRCLPHIKLDSVPVLYRITSARDDANDLGLCLSSYAYERQILSWVSLQSVRGERCWFCNFPRIEAPGRPCIWCERYCSEPSIPSLTRELIRRTGYGPRPGWYEEQYWMRSHPYYRPWHQERFMDQVVAYERRWRQEFPYAYAAPL